MNLLVIYTDSNRLDEGLVMDALQNAGVVSDNCVAIHDVAKPDDARAVEWLKKNYRKEKP